MDRVIVFPNALPRALDILRTNQFAMTGIGKLAEATFGTAAIIADGFTCTPTNPASLTVNIGPGQVMQVGNLENTAISSLNPNLAQIVKQGILLSTYPQAIAPQLGVGQSCCYLIQAQYADNDGFQETLNFYNAANPSVPLVGVSGSGGQSTTIRAGSVAFGVVPGTPTTGIPTPPSPTAGFIGLFVVTLTYGQSQINAGNIANYTGFPTIPDKLQNIPAGVQQNRYIYAKDVGSQNSLIVNPTPAIVAAVEGTELVILPKFTSTITNPSLTVSGNSAALVKRDGSALTVGDIVANVRIRVIYDGANWRVFGLVPSDYNIAGSGSAAAAAATQALKAAPYVQIGVPGTFTVTVPAGASAADVQIWGGGGGGGGVGAANNGTASGGGGGGYSRKFLTGLTPGQTFTLTVGAGGTAGGQGGAGGNGTTTTFGSVFSATGGGGGSANGVGSGGVYGYGTGGDVNLSGGYGCAGLNQGYGAGGAGGGCPLGGQGGGGAPGIAANGNAPGGGGGGSGAAIANNGTTGGPGGCLILWK